MNNIRAFSRSIAVSLGVCVGGLVGGCVNFDLAEVIEDTRILAIKTEPAEIFFSPLYLSPPAQRPPFPLPSTDVEVEVFAFDPRGGRTLTSIQMCPEDGGDSSCRLYDKDGDEDFQNLVEPAKSEVEALLTPAVYEDEIADDATPVGRTGPSTFRYTISPGAIDFFQPKNANGENVPSIFPLLPRFAVQVNNVDAEEAGEAVFKERAFKRLPLGLDLTDPTLPASFLQDLARGVGVSLCDGNFPEPVDADEDGVDDVYVEGNAECLFPRVANNNPGLKGLRFESSKVPEEFTQGMLEGDVDVGLGSVLRVKAGGQIALTPVWEAGVVERYQVISFDIEKSELIILNRVEDMACTWYATHGSVSSGLTSLQFDDDRLGILWTLPTEIESGQRDSLVLVALDQRGGTAVAEVTVVYE